MKNAKKFFIAAVAAMLALTLAVLGAARSFAAVGDNGRAMPASSGVARALSAGAGQAVELVDVGYEDMIYTSLGKYYVGD